LSVFHRTLFGVACCKRTRLFSTLFTPCHGLTHAVFQIMRFEWQCCNQVWGWFADKIYKRKSCA